MTSLQQQLSSIRAQSAQELNLKAQRVAHSKSLIFSPAEAASQSLFDIYQFCLRGFQELCKLDARVVPFATSLFSEHSIDVERTQLSKDANEKLDKTLESFLGLVGSHLQLRDAQCAVEWLIRRFRVHEYNTRFLILTFLPYHDTAQFSVMLQLIPESKLPTTFAFLRPYISARTNFKRPILIREASRRPALLGALHQYVLQVSRVGYQTENLIAFWVDVSIQALNGLLDRANSGRQTVRTEKQDEVLLEVASILHDGLQIRDAQELALGCYALAVFVARKVVLDDNWLDSLMISVAQAGGAGTQLSSLACLAVLAEERSTKRNRLPRAVITEMAHDPVTLASRLSAVNTNTNVNRLTCGLALGSLELYMTSHDRSYVSFISDILERGLVTKSKSEVLISRLIQATAHPSFEEESEHGRALINTLKTCARSPALKSVFEKAFRALESSIDSIPRSILIELGDHPHLIANGAADEATLESDARMEHTSADFARLSTSDTTFFSTDRSEDFVNLTKALVASTPRDTTQSSLQQKFFSGQLSPKVFTTFLIRVWSSSNSPLSARLVAIREGKQLLGHDTAEELPKEALLPFYMCALLDPERQVRQLAAESIAAVQTLVDDETRHRSKPHSFRALGLEIEIPSTSETKAFLRALSPHLESCVIDGSRTVIVVNRLLAGHSENLSGVQGKAMKELKTNVRAEIAELLASCAAHSKLLSVQLRIFPMLSHIGKIGSSVQQKHVYPTIRHWIEQDSGVAQSRCEAEGLRLESVDQQLFGLFHPKDTKPTNLFQQLVEGKLAGHREDLEEPSFQSISRLYAKTEVPASLLQSLMNTALGEGFEPISLSRCSAARDVFLSIHASTTTLSTLLAMLPTEGRFSDRPSPAKRRRTSKTDAQRPAIDSSVVQSELKKQTLILEKVEGSRSKSPELLAALFHALAQLIHFENATETKSDYLIQLVVRSLNFIFDRLITEGASQDSKKYQSSVRMDTLVECLRNNSSRGTQNEILSLVSKIAVWSPELVLHSVMPIFTFMGKNTVRQGDDYTAQVIARTIETVIPPLAKSLRKNNKGVVTALSEVLQSFAAAFEHIPSHRRLPLFGLLIKQLGAEESMFAVIALLVDRRPTDSTITVFLGDLLTMFDVVSELVTFKRCFDLLLDVHAPNAFAPRRTFSETVLNTKDKSPEQLQATVTNLLNVSSHLFERSELRSRIARLFKHSQETSSTSKTDVAAAYSQLLSQSINATQVLTRKQAASQKEARRALTSVMRVLPVAEVLPSIQEVLETASEDVKITAIYALEEQIQTTSQGDSVAVDALLAFIPQQCEVLRNTQDIELKQKAISCIDQTIEKFGRRNTSMASMAAQALVGEAALGHLDISLQIMALLTLASLVDVLREEFVPLIPRVLQQAYPTLEMSAGQERYDELRSALFAVLAAIIECLPQMLAHEDLDKAIRLCHKSAAGIPIPDDTTQRQELFALAVRHVPAEVCFAAAQRNLAHAIETGPEACSEHLHLILSLVQRHSKRVIREQARTIFGAVTEVWAVRRLRNTTDVFKKQYDVEAIDLLQHLSNEIAIATINKLNDDTLRPHFAALVEWATDSQPSSDRTSQLSSIASLFSLLKVLNERYKSLLTSYASYYLKLASDTLSSAQPTTELDVLVLQVVLDTLSSNFAGDESDYWQEPQHFEAIVSDLLNQIPRFAQSRGELLATHVFPALRGLASAAYSPDKRAQMNTEVLKMLRHEDARVRLAAVQCERELLDQVGEEWVTMVSQMLPFINEAQEDDDEQVERETRRWIKDLEAGLGESMAGMLQ